MVITDQDEPHAVINIRRTRVIEGRHRTPEKDDGDVCWGQRM